MSLYFSSVGSSCVPNVPKEAFLHSEITVKFTKIYESFYGNITAITQDCRHCKHKQENTDEEWIIPQWTSLVSGGRKMGQQPGCHVKTHNIKQH